MEEDWEEDWLEHFPFEKLNDHNWSVWSQRVKAWLGLQGLWEATQQARAEAPTAEQLRKDKRALASLLFSIEYSQFPHIEGLETAHEVWEALRRVHLQPTIVGSRVNTMRSLFNMKLKPGASVTEHANEMLRLFNKLRDLEFPFTEEQEAYVLLSSLDESFNTLRWSLESKPRQDLTVSYVYGLLRDVEDRRRLWEASEPRGGCAAKEGNVTPFTTRRCFRCNSKKHLIRDCPQQAPKDVHTSERGKRGNKGPGWHNQKPASRSGESHYAAFMAMVNDLPDSK